MPFGFADDVDDVDGGVAADLDCTGCVGSYDVADGVITGKMLFGLGAPSPGSHLAVGTITGEAVPDNSGGPTGNLALRTIGGDNIALKAITGGNMADATLSPRHLRSNVASAAGSSVALPDDTATTVVTTALVAVGGGTHTVLLVGDVAVDCSSCVSGDILTVTMERDGVMILSRSYEVSGPQGPLVLPVNGVDVGVPASGSGYTSNFSVGVTYKTASTSATATAASAVLTAVNLGD